MAFSGSVTTSNEKRPGRQKRTIKNLAGFTSRSPLEGFVIEETLFGPDGKLKKG
jgi:hypothetical protein